jgi:GxxExxY protein
MITEEKEFREYIGKQIVDIAFQLHKTLGPGLLESVYHKCFCYELAKRKIAFVTERKVPIVYDNIEFEEGLRLDLLIEDIVIVELKAQENYHPVWEAQLLSYLKLTNKELGFLINFYCSANKEWHKKNDSLFVNLCAFAP